MGLITDRIERVASTTSRLHCTEVPGIHYVISGNECATQYVLIT